MISRLHGNNLLCGKFAILWILRLFTNPSESYPGNTIQVPGDVDINLNLKVTVTATRVCHSGDNSYCDKNKQNHRAMVTESLNWILQIGGPYRVPYGCRS